MALNALVDSFLPNQKSVGLIGLTYRIPCMLTASEFAVLVLFIFVSV